MYRIWTLLFALLSAGGPLFGQAAEATSLAENTDKGRITFFGEANPELQVPRSLEEDDAFDRYLTLDELATAWSEADSQALARLVERAEEGERVLFRSRNGLPTEAIWETAIRVAEAQGDTEALQTLAQHAERLERKELHERLQTTLALAGTSRTAEARISVDPLAVPVEDFALLQATEQAVQHGAMRGDLRYLRDVLNNLPALLPNTPALQEKLKERLESEIKNGSERSLDPAVTKQMEVLLADSRGWGISIPTPRIPKPRIPKPRIPTINDIKNVDIHDVRRAGKKAREDIQRAGKKAREDIQRETVRSKTGLSEEAWGEAGRVAYPAAAGVMRARYARRLHESIGRHERAVLEPHFGADTLARVNLVWGVTPLNEWRAGGHTVHLGGKEAEAQTYGYMIYLRPGKNDQSHRDRLDLLIHELVHVKQYERYGRRLDSFGYHYFKKYKQANLKYENNQLEREAFDTASRLTPSVLAAYLRRVSGGPSSLAGTWNTNGRSVTFDTFGNATIRTLSGTATFRYTYNASTGSLTGVDSSGATTRTRLRWLSSDSFDWISPSGRRHYVRHRSHFGLH